MTEEAEAPEQEEYTRYTLHPLRCRCRQCMEERGDWEYHRRRDDNLERRQENGNKTARRQV